MTPDQFDVRCAHADGVFTVACRGAIDVASTPTMRDATLRALGSGVPVIVIDMRDVTLVDSAGLAALRLAHKAAEIADVEFQLVGARPSVVRVLCMAEADYLLGRVANVQPSFIPRLPMHG